MNDSAPTAPPTTIVPLSPDALVPVEGDRLMPDTVLGERLGYAEPRKIRDLIKEHRADIEARFGEIQTRRGARLVERSGRGTVEIPYTENLLTKRQALYVITKAGTSNANDVVQELVEVYDAVTSAPVQVTDDDSLVTILAKATDAKLAKLTAKVENVDSLATNLLTEQERIEREAMEERERTNARLAAVETRPPVILDKRPTAYPTKSPGPALPLEYTATEPTIKDTTTLRHDLRDSAVEVLRRVGLKDTNKFRYKASCLINYHGRLAASDACRRPLTSKPLGQLPLSAWDALHVAFRSEGVIGVVAEDMIKWVKVRAVA